MLALLTSLLSVRLFNMTISLNRDMGISPSLENLYTEIENLSKITHRSATK